MRKSQRPPEPMPYVLLRDIFPELVTELEWSLRKRRKRELAARIRDLRIYGRCDCGSGCGTFYCLPPDERRKLFSGASALEHPLYVAASGEILEVETLDPEVDASPLPRSDPVTLG
jgi:hypothetical protein